MKSQMRVLTVVLVVLLLACTTSSSNSGPSGPVQDCLDTLSALATAYDRCGTNYDTAYAQQLAAIAGGTCSNIVAVRDSDALEKSCIPSLRSITCTDLLAGNLDATCKLQLQRSDTPDAGTDAGP